MINMFVLPASKARSRIFVALFCVKPRATKCRRVFAGKFNRLSNDVRGFIEELLCHVNA